MDGFALQFDPAQLPALAARFPDSDETEVSAAGQAARLRGYYTRSEFVTVCRWKTPRSAPKVALNSAAAIRRACQAAFATESLEPQIRIILGLSGVGVPTASTLLHFAFPERFPILDVRALESLGVTGRSSYTPAFWASYVVACRSLAAAHGVSLRALDKALWQYSKERSDAD
jgi:hypothetical protein